MFDCQEYKNVLGEMTIKINTTTKDWNKLLETGLWDKVAKILNDTENSERDGIDE